MNIVHINLADQARGAAQAALRLHEAQIKLGHTSRMLVGYRANNRPDIQMLPARDTRWQRSLHRFVNRWEEYTGLQYLWQPWKNQFLRHPFTRQAEIINLHNIHSGFFPYTILPQLSACRPLVWTLHDFWGLTGHCGFPSMHDCERWKTGCGHCPALSDYPPIAIDTTAWLWRIKSKVYRRSKLTLVTPSVWLAGMVRQSPLLRQCEVHCIPHGVDTQVFRPMPKSAARRALGLPVDAKVILFSAFDPFQPRKGGVYLFEALQRLAREGRRDILLATVGSQQDRLAGKYQFPTYNLGLIRDEHRLAQCYSAADVYVGPSLAETFGLVYIEAMACGTPVIAFDCTAVPEVVRHQQTGYLARAKDVDDLVRGLCWLLDDDELRAQLGRQGRQLVEREYTLEQQARCYVELYEEVIARKRSRQNQRGQNELWSGA